MGYHRQWESDRTVLTLRVGLCRQRCCCMLYGEKKNGANMLCFVWRYFATEPQTQGRRRLAGRDASELSHRQEREQTTQTHFWFAKKLNETVAQWAAPKQHFIGYLSKKTKNTQTHTHKSLHTGARMYRWPRWRICCLHVRSQWLEKSLFNAYIPDIRCLW